MSSGALASATRELNATSPPIDIRPFITWCAPTSRNSTTRQQRHGIDGAVVAHEVKSALKRLRATPVNCLEHQVPEGRLGAQRFHRLDALDGIDLE